MVPGSSNALYICIGAGRRQVLGIRFFSKDLLPCVETWDNEYETPEPDSLSLYLWASGLNSCIASLLSLLHSRHTAHVLPPLLPVLVHGPLHRSTHQPPRFVQHGVDGSP